MARENQELNPKYQSLVELTKDAQLKQKQTEQMIQQLIEERDAIQRQCRQTQSEFEILAEELETMRANL